MAWVDSARSNFSILKSQGFFTASWGWRSGKLPVSRTLFQQRFPNNDFGPPCSDVACLSWRAASMWFLLLFSWAFSCRSSRNGFQTNDRVSQRLNIFWCTHSERNAIGSPQAWICPIQNLLVMLSGLNRIAFKKIPICTYQILRSVLWEMRLCPVGCLSKPHT